MDEPTVLPTETETVPATEPPAVETKETYGPDADDAVTELPTVPETAEATEPEATETAPEQTEMLLEESEETEESESEYVAFIEPEETTEAITIVEIRQIRDDIIHADLYGSFLVCGTLVGIALCWRWFR